MQRDRLLPVVVGQAQKRAKSTKLCAHLVQHRTVRHVIALLVRVDGVTLPISGGLQRVLAPASGWALICVCNSKRRGPIAVAKGVDSGLRDLPRLLLQYTEGGPTVISNHVSSRMKSKLRHEI